MKNVIYKARLEQSYSYQMEVNIILNFKKHNTLLPALYNYIKNVCKDLAQSNGVFAQRNGCKNVKKQLILILNPIAYPISK